MKTFTLAVLLLAFSPLSICDSKSEALLRQQLAASEAARIASEKDKVALAAALKSASEERKRAGKETTTGIAAVADQAAINAEIVRKNAEAQTAVALTAKTLAERTAKSSEMLTHPLWSTFALAILTAFSSMFTWMKTRKLEEVAKRTDANVLRVELSINSRMDAFLAAKDELLRVTRQAAAASETAALAKGAHDERIGKTKANTLPDK